MLVQQVIGAAAVPSTRLTARALNMTTAAIPAGIR